MSKTFTLLTTLSLIFLSFSTYSQGLRIKKGTIIDSLAVVGDSIPETFSLYLPNKFELNKKWPLLMVFDMEGRGKDGISKFVGVADSLGYVVAAPNSIRDSVPISENMQRTKRVVDYLLELLPVNKSRIYTAGFESGGRFANLVPIFFREIVGTVSINAAIANTELLNAKNPFHFIGVVDKTNFNYPTILRDEKVLNGLKFPNHILVGDSLSNNTTGKRLAQALSYFELLAMARGNTVKDSGFIEAFYQSDLGHIKELLDKNEFFLANRAMAETQNIFRTLRDTDSLREMKKNLKRTKGFRIQKRELETTLFKETLLREDFAYYLEEDVLTYNFNNLGWWNFQMERINKFINGSNAAERKMGYRLVGYVNALVEDNIYLVKSQKIVDEEALVLLFMLKTIAEPNNFDNYLKVASIASKNEDFGTALFYLEEALKKGFNSKEQLYNIPNTALLRITPEFNALVKKYLDNARYKTTIDE
ncbi:alpha/beta hydrolase [Muricauda sp. SCSIO 64092]|uniref:alpha/beta hydrolase n=1 Tax=Allomuricauda sp. SCSIO 64092 TaxID=2908842 RepID=UPI001FF21C7F|nr:alpha/beta hydrolase [Muricauda sp. SCSIO 64092]UOY05534.1 alpha/beta hydrolase [Muricauda sp. SCSIO 64092]